MKKILVLLCSMILLASCFGSSKQNIQDAKKDILGDNIVSQTSEDTTSSEDNNEVTTPEVKVEKPMVKINPIDEVQFLDFNTISEKALKKGEVEISGKTLSEVDKITVSFSNAMSDYPDDAYTLKTFKAGGKTFKYLASSRFKVLDFGENIYSFKAYSGKEVSETQITLVLEKEAKDEEIKDISKTIGIDGTGSLVDLPTSDSFGTPIMLGEDSFTYSEIQGFEVKKVDTSTISCEEITDYLSDNINTWFYWNTCRDLIKDKAITFYVLRLNGEEYVYQKHYVDFVHNFYGIYDIETGISVTKDNIQDKNNELKEINDTFENTTQIDRLFKEIVN